MARRQTPTIAVPPTGLYGLRRRLRFATGIGHFYAVHRRVWLSAAPDSDCRLCLDCLQARLGRQLMVADFVAIPFEILSRFVAGALDGAFEPCKG